MKRERQAGFTILELMVALSITAICVGLVSASLVATIRTHRKTIEHMELTQSMNETMERMRVLLQAAYLSPYPTNIVFSRFETFDLDNVSDPYDAITFSTLAHTSHKIDAREADLVEVTLFTREAPPIETPEGEERVRRLMVRVGGDINDRFEVEGGKVYALADNVTQLLFEYLTPEGEWKPEWFAADRGSLPCAVRVTMGMRSENLQELTASIMVPMEMSKVQCKFDDERVFEEEF